jgi:hypothetical protein
VIRPLRIVLTLALLGAITTVAVAWALVLTRPPTQAGGFHFSHETDPLWYFSRAQRPGSDWIFCGVTVLTDVGGWDHRPDLCPPWSLVAARPNVEQAGADQDVWWEEARGWPRLALAGRLRLGDGLQVKAASGTIVLARRAGEPVPVILPARPLWPGFLVDTAFYAVTLGVMLASGRLVRRRWRLKRGRCPICVYPIGASPVCTECGSDLQGHGLDPGGVAA